MSTVRLRRLQADYDKLREYIDRHPRLQLIQADGTPPERYQLELRIRGMRQVGDESSIAKSHMIEISLPLSYPRMPPSPAPESDRHCACPHCRSSLRLIPQLAGKQVRCLQCRTVFRLPAQ
jgi:hypothetical protein